MDEREEHTNKFTARSEDGRSFVIHEFTTFFTTQGDKDALVTRGLKRFALDDQRFVRFRGKGRYEIVDPFGRNVIVISDDADAQ
jgi:hypothetical protein